MKIILHSARMVFGHLGQAFRISGFLYIASMVLIVVITWNVPLNSLEAGLHPLLLVSSLVAGFASLWTAVGWHRFILLDEMPGSVLPVLHSNRIWAYFGKSVLLALFTAVLPRLDLALPADLRQTAKAHGDILAAAQSGDHEGYRKATIEHYEPLLRMLDGKTKSDAGKRQPKD